MKELEKLTIAALKKGYSEKKFTPLDVCKLIIERAEATKEKNIWIKAPDMELIRPYLEALETKDKELPLWGIPFAIKDNIDLKGVYTTAGCESYAYMPEEDATVVRLLIEAGAIPVGKANLDQFATGLVGTRSLYGETHNALKPELISGGSSSGSAVAVAMGQAAFALGTDTAGSGRVPAALNNLVGYKSSLGAWSTKGVVPACASLDCVTVFTHNLEDAELVDQVVRVYDETWAWSKKVKPVKLGLPKKVCIPKTALTFYGPYKAEYEKGWKQSIKRLSQLGIEVEEIDYTMFSEAASILYDGPWIAERWAALGKFIEENKGKAMVPVTEKILRSGNKENLKADDVFKAMHRLAEIKAKVRVLLKDALLLMPTAGGTYTREEVNQDPIATNSNMGLYTNHCNLLDLCALDFPAGFVGEHLPFGLTAFALREEEGINLGFAKLFEQTLRESEDIETTKLVVCGLHMRGFELEHQLLELGAEFVSEVKTAPIYKLYELPGVPQKPGMVRVKQGGTSLKAECYSIPTKNLGFFLKQIPAPLGLGKVVLENNEEVIGFLCETEAVEAAKEITSYGGWRAYRFKTEK